MCRLIQLSFVINVFHKLIELIVCCFFFLLSFFILVANRVGKVHYAINVNHIRDVFMEHAKNHGNAIVKKVGVDYFAIKI